MTYQIFEDGHCYICHDGRELRHIRTERKEPDRYIQTFEVPGTEERVRSLSLDEIPKQYREIR